MPRRWGGGRGGGRVEEKNPDEIAIDDDDEVEKADANTENPDEIRINEEEPSEDPPPVLRNSTILEPPAETEDVPSVPPLESSLKDSASPLAPTPPVSGVKETRFMALDKCLPRRDFLEVSLYSELLPINLTILLPGDRGSTSLLLHESIASCVYLRQTLVSHMSCIPSLPFFGV